jgi:NAD/NADP transhydrogenase beta subunit
MSQPGFFSPRLLIDISYFITAALFILGLKRMSSPVTARSGILWAGAGMLVATLVTFLYPGMSNYELIVAAIVVGSLFAWWSGKRVAMTDMPQMIALYNGMGGGAAAAIAAVELYRAAHTGWPSSCSACSAASSAQCRSRQLIASANSDSRGAASAGRIS